MAMTEHDIRLAAGRLHQAEKTRQQIRQLSLDHPGITIADAYAIQKAWVAIKLGVSSARGSRPSLPSS
jgi:2-oxo-hept-3-ene-1,7-dioate hydratase